MHSQAPGQAYSSNGGQYKNIVIIIIMITELVALVLV